MQSRRVVAPILACAAAALLAGCREARQPPPRFTVFAAASMAEVLAALGESFTTAHGLEVSISPAASGVLRRQIEGGAGCDVFIAADLVDMDKLAARGLIRAETRRPVARNRLVLIGCGSQQPFDDVAALADAATGRIALGDPAYVPAGRYARRALEAAGVWAAVEARAVLADNVRVACAYVQAGQADLALVYATDAALLEGCRVLCTIDESLSGPIVYPGAVCAKSAHPKVAAEFLAFLAHPDQREVWAAYGFSPWEPAAGAEP